MFSCEVTPRVDHTDVFFIAAGNHFASFIIRAALCIEISRSSTIPVTANLCQPHLHRTGDQVGFSVDFSQLFRLVPSDASSPSPPASLLRLEPWWSAIES